MTVISGGRLTHLRRSIERAARHPRYRSASTSTANAGDC